MKIVKVSTQAELEQAIKDATAEIWLIGSGDFTVSDSAQVTACGSARVTACDSARVAACDSAQVTAYDSAQVTASKQVAVTITGGKPKVVGGVKILYKHPTTMKEWLENYALKPAKGIVVLYKGVDANYNSEHGTNYAPGSTPSASDWDGGKRECGGGLHFSPAPAMALKFTNAKKFVACPVKVSEIRHPKKDDAYPDKVKAQRVVKPGCYEVDIHGNPVKS